MKEKMQTVEKLWNAFEKYKENAEQHEFIRLAMYDSKLLPAYNDLHENYNDEHADIFIRGMKKVLLSFGIDYIE